MSQLEWYKSVLSISKDKLNQSNNNPVDKTEYERLYTLSFLGCLLLINSSESSTVFLTQDDENIFIHYSENLAFSLNKETVKVCLRKHYEELKFKEEKEEDIKTTESTEKNEQTVTEEVIVTETEVITEKAETVKEQVITEMENTVEAVAEEPVLNTKSVSEVEIVEMESVIDYSTVIAKVTEEKNEKVVAEETIVEEKKMEKTRKENTPKGITELYFSEDYPKDVSKQSKLFDSFIFDQYLIEAEDMRILANIFPLYYTDNAPISSDIFIVFKSDTDTYRGYKSSFESERKMVRATFDKYEFIARGKWINGNFESSLTLAKAANVTIQKKSHIPKNRTATTHMITNYNECILHIFPTDWKNHEKTGVAGALIYSETEDVIMTPNPQTQIPYSKDKADLIQVYWQGKGEQAELRILEE